MQILLFDTEITHGDLLPLTYTRPVAALRVGIVSIEEKWKLRGYKVSMLSRNYLRQKYKPVCANDHLYINAAILPDASLCDALSQLAQGQALFGQEQLIALRSSKVLSQGEEVEQEAQVIEKIPFSRPVAAIRYAWDIFAQNRAQIIEDFALITKGRKSEPVRDSYSAVYEPDQVFIEEGASLRAAVLNAESGPIYIGKNATVGEGSLIRGAFALCEGATLNMGAKMRGDTTIGPHCKVGGEIGNSVLMAHSNKGHEGYLGNSVLGEWCNLGADTNTSNLKNNYSNVKVWNFRTSDWTDTGRQFCGLIMGDHVKCSINTMFNTGTCVGPCVNLFGADFPPKMVPPFAWGGSRGFSTFRYDKVRELAFKVMERRGGQPSDEDMAILQYLYEQTASLRTWEQDSTN